MANFRLSLVLLERALVKSLSQSSPHSRKTHARVDPRKMLKNSTSAVAIRCLNRYVSWRRWGAAALAVPSTRARWEMCSDFELFEVMFWHFSGFELFSLRRDDLSRALEKVDVPRKWVSGIYEVFGCEIWLARDLFRSDLTDVEECFVFERKSGSRIRMIFDTWDWLENAFKVIVKNTWKQSFERQFCNNFLMLFQHFFKFIYLYSPFTL